MQVRWRRYLHDEAVRCRGINGLPFHCHGSVEKMVEATGECLRMLHCTTKENVHSTHVYHKPAFLAKNTYVGSI